MISKEEAIRDAAKAFMKLHGGHDCRLTIRGLDRGELNLNNMDCIPLSTGGWACSLPHIHLPLMTFIYEFTYRVVDGRKPQYSCHCVTPPILVTNQ